MLIDLLFEHMYQASPVTSDDLLVNISTSTGYSIIEPTGPESTARLDNIIDAYKEQLDSRTKLHLGYPYNLDFDFSALHGLQSYSINNLGITAAQHAFSVQESYLNIYTS